MSERKVLNKYFPPDFDPSKIPRRKIARDAQQTVRLMAPFTMCCTTCGEFIYKGKKFNAKKETALGETYYGIKIFRFYIKCTRCSAEITFKTDPKNADYLAEHGATRNFEPTTTQASAMPHASADDVDSGAEDAEDPMKALEESQAAAKRQMEEEDDLADLRQRNARMERAEMDAETILAQQHALSEAEAARRKKEQEEEDEIVKKYFYKVQAPGAENGTSVPVNGAQTNGKKDKGKGKEKENNGINGLGGYSSGSESGNDDADEEEEEEEKVPVESHPNEFTVKRKPGIGGVDYEPTVADLLASKGISVPTFTMTGVSKAPISGARDVRPVISGVKRKDPASVMGIKLGIKKKKVV